MLYSDGGVLNLAWIRGSWGPSNSIFLFPRASSAQSVEVLSVSGTVSSWNCFCKSEPSHFCLLLSWVRYGARIQTTPEREVRAQEWVCGCLGERLECSLSTLTSPMLSPSPLSTARDFLAGGRCCCGLNKQQACPCTPGLF